MTSSVNNEVIVGQFGKYQLVQTEIKGKGFLGIGNVKRPVLIIKNSLNKRVEGFEVRLAKNRTFFEKLFKKTTSFQLQFNDANKPSFSVISSTLNDSLSSIKKITQEALTFKVRTQSMSARNGELPSSSNIETNGAIVESYFAFLHEATVFREEGSNLKLLRNRIKKIAGQIQSPFLINDKNGTYNKKKTEKVERAVATELKNKLKELKDKFGISRGKEAKNNQTVKIYKFNGEELVGYKNKGFNYAQFIAKNLNLLPETTKDRIIKNLDFSLNEPTVLEN